MGLQKVGHSWSTKHSAAAYIVTYFSNVNTIYFSLLIYLQIHIILSLLMFSILFPVRLSFPNCYFIPLFLWILKMTQIGHLKIDSSTVFETMWIAKLFFRKQDSSTFWKNACVCGCTHTHTHPISWFIYWALIQFYILIWTLSPEEKLWLIHIVKFRVLFTTFYYGNSFVLLASGCSLNI